MARLLLAMLVTALLMVATAAGASVYPPGVSSRDVPGLMQATAYVRSLDDAALRALVPVQSGLYYVGCPNCNGGRQENQLAWTPDRPNEVYCQYCNHRYPSTTYPDTQSVNVHNPRGEAQQYPYWADSAGYRYFFQARRDDLVKNYLATATRNLALLYAATGDAAHARRAALLLKRFAEVFPGWCYHYDYPFQQKIIYDGDVPPAKFRSNYRTARWTWWAYSDIPTALVQAYDWVRDSGAMDEATDALIRRDLFRNAGDQVLNNVDDYSNMSPSEWTSLVTLGRVINWPGYVHEPVRRLERFVDTQFLYDSAWHEGAPSYHSQTLGGLNNVLTALRGYSDPEGYLDPVDQTRFDNADLAASYPGLVRSNAALLAMRLPNGRAIPVHDTWATDKRPALTETKPWLLPALGYAVLGGGSGDAQNQFHLTWGGGYGHQHGDDLNLLVYAKGREFLSDLGYSHTRYRSWTLATAAHNTVAIDGLSQNFGSTSSPSDGVLRFYDTGDPAIQTISASAERGYPKNARVYRRTLAVLDGRIAVDIFEVEGGALHDYFLHGDADAASTVEAPLPIEPLASLLPAGFAWKPTQNEGEAGKVQDPWYAYGFLRNLRLAAAPGDAAPVTFRMNADNGPALRVTLLPEAGSQLVLGEDPSIRMAAEDDARVDEFVRPFLMLRHAASRSVFASVIEPLATDAPPITAKRLAIDGAALAMTIRQEGRTDIVVYGAPDAVTVPVGDAEASFSGDLGVLTLDGDKVVRAYAIGTGGWTMPSVRVVARTVRGNLAAIRAEGTMEIQCDGAPPAAGSVIRLLTADGWVYPFTVTAADAGSAGTIVVAVAEGPGFSFEAGAAKMVQTAYPQRTHAGPVAVDWQTPGRFGTAASLVRKLPGSRVVAGRPQSTRQR